MGSASYFQYRIIKNNKSGRITTDYDYPSKVWTRLAEKWEKSHFSFNARFERRLVATPTILLLLGGTEKNPPEGYKVRKIYDRLWIFCPWEVLAELK